MFGQSKPSNAREFLHDFQRRWSGEPELRRKVGKVLANDLTDEHCEEAVRRVRRMTRSLLVQDYCTQILVDDWTPTEENSEVQPFRSNE